MTNQDKLRVIIQRATDNGWDGGDTEFYVVDAKNGGYFSTYDYYLSGAKGLSEEIRARGDEPGIIPVDLREYERVIFSHDFAKAFWGEVPYCSVCEESGHALCGYPDTGEYWETWEWQIQQLVLQEDRIDYLYSFIGGEK